MENFNHRLLGVRMAHLVYKKKRNATINLIKIRGSYIYGKEKLIVLIQNILYPVVFNKTATKNTTTFL
jgi:hypothetical protein